jgi:hypothetical protein
MEAFLLHTKIAVDGKDLTHKLRWHQYGISGKHLEGLSRDGLNQACLTLKLSGT